MGGLGILVIMIGMMLILLAVLVIAAILLGVCFTGLAGGAIFWATGKHFSKNTGKKVESRICIGIGVILFLIACGSAGVIISYAIKFFG
ncbi:hypothetical protein [Butyrivibrio sp. JL13D10]|uniref:hypothetical protein n=1 Tax=Butyrivibrio sp. JL13D10 TaxID=3236815 RepID=UPI0038B5956D